MDKHVITRIGLLDAQVCSIGTYEEAGVFLNREAPAGTENGWVKKDDGAYAPVKCESHPERTHYYFVC